MSINRPVVLIIAGAALVGAVALARPAWEHWHEVPPPPPPALRATLLPLADIKNSSTPDQPFAMALAPDGRRLAFSGARDGPPSLWIRNLAGNSANLLGSTEAGSMPFWSPDGRQLGFFVAGRLKILNLQTHEVIDVAEAPAPRGGAWRPNGNIVFASNGDAGLSEWYADGSGVKALTTLDASTSETSHRFPAVLQRPDQAAESDVVYLVQAREPTRAGLWTTSGVRLTASDSSAIVANDWLLYARGDALLAQRIEWREENAGKPALMPAAQSITLAAGHSPLGQLSATAGGDTLIVGAAQPSLRDLRWIDRDGSQSTLATEVQVSDVRIAPNGGRVAVTQLDPQLGTLDIWVYEGGRLLPRRISQALDVDDSPAWSPDAARLVWVQARRTLASRGSGAQLPEHSLRKFDTPIKLWDWTADGRTLVIGQTRPGSKDDLLTVDAIGDAAPTLYASGPFNEMQARVSPDGRAIAYASDESGQPEIYVDSFPAPGPRARVSTGGGSEPRWGASRSEQGQNITDLYFRRGSEIHVVTVAFGGERPEPLATRRVLDAGGEISSFDVSANGERFLVNVPAPGSRDRPISLIVNWMSLLQ